MWEHFDTEVKAKMSVPIILYTTEQIFCAHFLVSLFKKWLGRDDIHEAEIAAEPEMAVVERPSVDPK